jgi:hypothetical protein
MKKYRVLQLSLQLGFPIAMDTCNSWYLHCLECYWTSYSNYNRHLMSYIISYIRCNSHATICNLFATNLHVIFPHTFQCGEWNVNMAFHPFVDKWCILLPFATYFNYFTISLTNIIFNYFIHWFDEWILFLYFITYLQLFYN